MQDIANGNNRIVGLRVVADLLKAIIFSAFYLSIFSAVDTKLTTSPQVLLNYPFICISLVYLLFKHRVVPVYLLYFAFIAGLLGTFQIVLGNNSFALLLKAIFSISIIGMFFFLFIKEFNYDVSAVFGFYLKGAVFCSYVVIFQGLCYLLGLKYGYDLSYLGISYDTSIKNEFRPSAFFREPAHYSAVIAPAMFIALHNLLRKGKDFISRSSSLVIISAVVISASSTGYIALLLCFLFIAINYRALRFIFSTSIVGALAFFLLYTSVPDFKKRFDDSVAIFITQTITDEQQLKNGSTMILYNNFHIALENFSHHPIAGTGLGSHPIAFDRYNEFDDQIWWYDLNKEDANSMFIRMLSETGLFGLSMLLLYLIRHSRFRWSAVSTSQWLISNSLIVLVLTNLLRQGNYAGYGFPFFLLLLYYNVRPRLVTN
jgi:hypothetical protein